MEKTITGKHAQTRKESRRKPKKLFKIITLFITVTVAVGGLKVYKNLKQKQEQQQEAIRLEQIALEQERQRIEQLTLNREELLTQAQTLAKSYYYDEAIALLSDVQAEVINEQVSNDIAQYQQLKAGLVAYNGSIYHIFFHSLIIYPELAFDNKGHPAQGYNMWMTTRDEFVKMLPLLHQNGFVLYDIESLITRNDDGTITQAKILLPEGKKPLVISIDDVCYYDYMKTDGFANRLVIDENGQVVTEVKAPDGTISVTKDGDVMPILDEYVKNNPDFSYKGAKGVIAVTGYEGALGYRVTDLNGEELAAARQTLSEISKNLRANGWKFACHSYTHNAYFRDGTITMDELQSDTTRWKTLIEPYIGETKIYISPFGVHFDEDDARYQYIVSQDFDIYCGVGNTLLTKFYGTSMTQDRFDMDGYMMFNKPDYVAKHYFNVKDVIDSARPKLN